MLNKYSKIVDSLLSAGSSNAERKSTSRQEQQPTNSSRPRSSQRQPAGVPTSNDDIAGWHDPMNAPSLSTTHRQSWVASSSPTAAQVSPSGSGSDSKSGQRSRSKSRGRSKSATRSTRSRAGPNSSSSKNATGVSADHGLRSSIPHRSSESGSRPKNGGSHNGGTCRGRDRRRLQHAVSANDVTQKKSNKSYPPPSPSRCPPPSKGRRHQSTVEHNDSSFSENIISYPEALSSTFPPLKKNEQHSRRPRGRSTPAGRRSRSLSVNSRKSEAPGEAAKSRLGAMMDNLNISRPNLFRRKQSTNAAGRQRSASVTRVRNE